MKPIESKGQIIEIPWSFRRRRIQEQLYVVLSESIDDGQA
jgi:hypothetical protein